MRTRVVCMLTLIIMTHSISADSLWDPESPGLLSGSGDLQVGDTVLVSIDSKSTLSYSSSRVDSERVSIELTGGDGGNLFSFLPSGSSAGNQSLQGSESVSVQVDFPVRITAIDAGGTLTLQGSRTVSIQGKRETIVLSGAADPIFVGEDRALPFSSMLDARLTYTTFLQPGIGVVRPQDLVRAEPDPESEVSSPALSLSAEKRDELLLIYLNRLLDLVFE